MINLVQKISVIFFEVGCHGSENPGHYIN